MFRNFGWAITENDAGASAESIWRSLPTFLSDDQDRLFVSLKLFEDNREQQYLFESIIDRAIGRYFPGTEAEVKQLMVGAPS